jgi:hypothetical protein
MESCTKETKLTRKPHKKFLTTNPGLPFPTIKTSLRTATPGSWKILYTRKNHPRPQWTAGNYQSRFSQQRAAGQRRNPASAPKLSRATILKLACSRPANAVSFARLCFHNRIVWPFQGLPSLKIHSNAKLPDKSNRCKAVSVLNHRTNAKAQAPT